MEFFDPNNAFDAEGLTRLTEETQNRSRERNEIEQDTTVAIARKNFEAKQQKLEIDRQKRFAELAQSAGSVEPRSRAGGDGRQGAGAKRSARPKRRRSSSQRQIREAEVAKQQAVRQREVEAEREVQIASIRAAAGYADRRAGARRS